MSNQAGMEEWRKERMYGERDTVLWAILDQHGIRVIGSFLREEDADQAIADQSAARVGSEALAGIVRLASTDIQDYQAAYWFAHGIAQSALDAMKGGKTDGA